MSAADALRALLTGDSLVHLPGVYDAVSARLAARAGAPAVHLSGATVSAVELGVPDLGFVHGSEIARRAAARRGHLGPPGPRRRRHRLRQRPPGPPHHRGLRRRRRRRPAPRGPGRAQALRPPRRQGGRRPGRGDHPDPGRGRRRDGSGRRGPHRRAAGPRPRRGARALPGLRGRGRRRAVRRGCRPPRCCTGSARRCRGCRWSTAGPRPGDRSMPARPTPSSRRSGCGW